MVLLLLVLATDDDDGLSPATSSGDHDGPCLGGWGASANMVTVGTTPSSDSVSSNLLNELNNNASMIYGDDNACILLNLYVGGRGMVGYAGMIKTICY